MKTSKEKPVQYFTKEYLARCAGTSTDNIIQFLDDYCTLVAEEHEKCQLISLKIEPSLLKTFKMKANLEGIPYQTLIKKLMKEWLINGGSST